MPLVVGPSDTHARVQHCEGIGHDGTREHRSERVNLRAVRSGTHVMAYLTP